MPKYSNWLTKQLSKLKNSNFPKNSKFAKHWKWGILKTVFDGESDVGDLTLVTIKGCWWQNIPISSPTSVNNIDVTVFNSWVGYWKVLSNLNIDRWTWKVRSMFISTNFHNFVPLPVIFFSNFFYWTKTDYCKTDWSVRSELAKFLRMGRFACSWTNPPIPISLRFDAWVISWPLKFIFQ